MMNPPPDVEVNHLHYAVLTTFGHCGLIWFSDDIVEPVMIIASICAGFNSFRLVQFLYIKQGTVICSCIDVKGHPPAYTRLSRGRKEEGRRKKWVMDSISSCMHILIGNYFYNTHCVEQGVEFVVYRKFRHIHSYSALDTRSL